MSTDITVKSVEAVVAKLLAPAIPEPWRVVLHAQPEELEPDTVAVTVEETGPLPDYNPAPANLRRHSVAVTAYGDRTQETEALAATLLRAVCEVTARQWEEAAEAVAEDTIPGDPLPIYWTEPNETRMTGSYEGAAAALTVHLVVATGSLILEEVKA